MQAIFVTRFRRTVATARERSVACVRDCYNARGCAMDLTRNTAGRFWLLQASGWSIYALDRYLSEQSFFPFYFIYLCIAFALTSVVLRPARTT